jgi:hypothetical protein
MRRLLAPLSTMLFCSVVLWLVLITEFAPPASAQNQEQADTQAVPRVYDASREVVLRGTISEVNSKPVTGLPQGFHVLLSTAQGSVDAHLGPNFGRSPAAKSLVSGAVIQVTGVTSHYVTGDIFLARIVLVGNQTITVRNENGLPVPMRPAPQGARANRTAQPTGGQ